MAHHLKKILKRLLPKQTKISIKSIVRTQSLEFFYKNIFMYLIISQSNECYSMYFI